jgi:hypothetical protein
MKTGLTIKIAGVVGVLAMVGIVHVARANPVPLADGQTVMSGVGGTLVSVPLPTGAATLVASEKNTLVKSSLGSKYPAGTLSSWVYSGTTAQTGNPLGGDVFVYKIAISGTSTTFADIFADSGDWNGFLTDVGYNGTIAPSSANREDGVITWDFATHLTDGTSSAYLIVDTKANKIKQDYFDVEDGGTSIAKAYVPQLTVPDGGMTLSMLGLGILAIHAFRRKTA